MLGCTGHVLDDDRLSERITEPVRQKPHDDIDAGRKSEQQPDISRRIFRLRAGGKSREQDEYRRARETNGPHHKAPVAGDARPDPTSAGFLEILVHIARTIHAPPAPY
jgi:hypothetical protein